MKHRLVRTLSFRRLLLEAILAFGIGIVVMATSCSRPPQTAESWTCFVGLDVSPSMVGGPQKNSMALLSAAAERALPVKTEVQAWDFSSPDAADPVFEASVSGAADLKALRQRYLRPLTGQYTYIAPLLGRVLERARRADPRREKLALILCTDGGWDDAEAARPLATSLANCPSVVAVWVGPVALQSGVRASVEDVFAPFDRKGRRLIVSNELDQMPALARFRALLRRAR